MANDNFRARGPKRQIEQSYSRINHVAGVGMTDTILHTAEDRETLVRAIVDIDAVQDGAVFQNLAISLQVAPKGVPIQTIGVAESLDLDKANQTIMVMVRGGMTQGNVSRFQADIKGMRKLQVSDEIILRDIASAAAVFTVVGTVTLIFKE